MCQGLNTIGGLNTLKEKKALRMEPFLLVGIVIGPQLKRGGAFIQGGNYGY
jgi:hypothetical protein